MWYKNKRTGKTWDITDEKILKRISKDSDYEPVEEELPDEPEEEMEEVEEELPDEPEEEMEEVEEELPFVPDEEPEVNEAPKKAGGRRGTAAAKAKK